MPDFGGGFNPSLSFPFSCSSVGAADTLVFCGRCISGGGDEVSLFVVVVVVVEELALLNITSLARLEKDESADCLRLGDRNLASIAFTAD